MIALLFIYMKLPHNVTAKLFRFIYQSEFLLSMHGISQHRICLIFIELYKFTLKAHYKQSSFVGERETHKKNSMLYVLLNGTVLSQMAPGFKWMIFLL